MVDAFIAQLGEYPSEKVMKAFKTHIQRSPKMPTLADICLLIKHNGRAPITKQEADAVLTKPDHMKDHWDWVLLKKWKAQQQEGWDGVSDQQRILDLQKKNQEMRNRLEISEHNSRRAEEHLQSARKRIDDLTKQIEDRTHASLKTVAWLRDNFSQQAVLDFINEQQIMLKIKEKTHENI